MQRRSFLVQSGLCLASGAFRRVAQAAAPKSTIIDATTSWDDVRQLFNLDPRYLHFAGLLLASHPKPVRDAIDVHRRALDADPAHYFLEFGVHQEQHVRDAAARYLNTNASQIALTDSTTMGLGLVFGGLHLESEQEVLFSEYEHYSTARALDLRVRRDSIKVRQITYPDITHATADALVEHLTAQIHPHTRVLVVTWVHSATGLKMPIKKLAAALTAINHQRAPGERVLLCVDGVHGFGVEPIDLSTVGCDIFVAGCHKWLFGPRGTGLVWARADVWPLLRPSIPSFEWTSFVGWVAGKKELDTPLAWDATPGGFHSFEHRWALDAAFDLHQNLGPARIAERIRSLATQTRDGLAALSHVKVVTPADPDLRAGIICFDIAGMDPHDVTARLWQQGIVASTTPYARSHARLATGLLNSPREVDKVIQAMRALG